MDEKIVILEGEPVAFVRFISPVDMASLQNEEPALLWPLLLLMEEILYHLGSKKPCK